MEFNQNYLMDYLAKAPLALAIERIVECRILSEKDFKGPILDIGVGEGLFASILFRDKIDLGIDPNAREIQRAKQLGGYFELARCFGDKIEGPDNSYRTVLSNSVLEHIKDLNPVLQEACRLLAPGGRFYVTVPSDLFEHYTIINQTLLFLKLDGLAERYRAFFNRFWVHYHGYSVRKWASLFEEAGFTVLESRTYAPRYLCILNDCLVPFSFLELLTKKLFNRWTLFPSFRRVIMFPIGLLVKRLVEGADNVQRGGLVFLVLTKS